MAMDATLAMAWKSYRDEVLDQDELNTIQEMKAEVTFLSGAHWVLGQLGKELTRSSSPEIARQVQARLNREGWQRLRELEQLMDDTGGTA